MKVLGIEPKGVQSVLFGPGHLDAALRFFHPFEGDGKVHANIELLKRARHRFSQARKQPRGDLRFRRRRARRRRRLDAQALRPFQPAFPPQTTQFHGKTILSADLHSSD